ncbi:hypothetical protein TRAPUB_6934 [Trametes pubescens]|uniref:DUF6589 domain-containing protein n=1 Tax=Trametes pubescens TaxID=154538 RepID=A0A1M2V4Q7_TRAPU|nr:hypothetical protein TRAPUB_6934 [Trametes pubescens]
MSDRSTLLRNILSNLQSTNVTLSELFTFVVVHNQFNGPNDTIFQDIVNNTRVLLSSLYHNPATAPSTVAWTQELTRMHYSNVVSQLTRVSHGWHFGATQADPSQIQDFQLDDMAAHLEQSAPDLWALVLDLLGGWTQGTQAKAGPAAPDSGIRDERTPFWEDPEDDEYWGGDDVLDTGAGGQPLDKPADTDRRRKRRSVTGIFLHSCGAPEKLVKVLSRMGISIGLSSVHRAVKSLAAHGADDAESLAQTLLVSYAFDNLDFQLPSGIPTVEKSADGLIHITTGTLLHLEHGVKKDDLRCSKILWERSESNPLASDPRPYNPRATMLHLFSLHPEPEVPEGGLSRRGKFRAWFLVRTLIRHGPARFAYFRTHFRDPASIESIPITKLQQQPLRAMDISLSTISGNMEALTGLYAQGGVGNPHEDPSRPNEAVVDLSEYVTLIHGDLGSYEKVLSVLRRRKQERSPHDRLQSVVFVMGLFHLKMASADAIWRVLVSPEGARVDNTSFMKLVGQLRPDASSRLTSNAKFRDRHDLISHVVALLLLDAWRVEVKKRWGYATLEAWAETKPSVADVQEVAECIAREYIEGDGHDIYATSSTGQRDKVKENTLRTLNYLLLYEELSYAMNAGDIGRVETLFPIWIQIFRAVGKHKYANHMLRFMHALYFVYPDELRYAIRYNILVNPTGKPHAFRAIDWIVELLNLYIKVIYGGEGSNFTKNRVLLESILVLIYRSSHANFERNFKIPGLSSKHAEKDMRATFQHILDEYIKKYRPNEYVAGRGASYTIPDQVVKGAEVLRAEWAAARRGETAAQDDDGGDVGAMDNEVAEGPELTADDISAEGVI